MKIVLTGGHLTPAYAFAETARDNQDELMMIGSSGADSTEKRELTRVGAIYQHISATKFDRHHKLTSYLKLPLLITSVLQSIRLLKVFRPDIVVTFGSYNAVPVAFAAMCLKIPFVTHEQTRTVGFANRLLAPFASAKAVSYETTKSAYADKNVVVTGNILRRAIWSPPQNPPFTVNSSKPILYVTGGNQGSQIIINSIIPLLERWSTSYQLVIQYGKTKLEPHLIPSGTCAKSWFSAQETAWLLHHAHVVISRGGANTVAELMVAGAPSVIIPLPNTTGDEQTKNAAMISEKSAGILLDQADLSPRALYEAASMLEENYQKYAHAAAELRLLQDEMAVDKLYQLVKQHVRKA